MRKAVFGSVLTFLISMIFAALALIVIWSVLTNVFGFSGKILLGAAQKFVCQGGQTQATVFAGAGIVGATAAGCAVGAAVSGPGAPIGCIIGGLIGGIGSGIGGAILTSCPK